MNSEIAFIFKLIQKELWFRWKLGLLLFIITALTFLAAAWIWPKVFTSSSIVLVNQQTILSPLMQGTAVTTEVRNRSKLASQIVLSQRAMQQVITSDVWAGASAELLTAREFDRLTNEIRDKASVIDVGQNLIEISFKDNDANKAFQTATLLTDIFIQESINTKQQESGNAYQFIDEQVTIYQSKLRQAEQAIKEFRSVNVDATQEAKASATTRLVELKREQETVELEISTVSAGVIANKKRLTGEVNSESEVSFIRDNDLQLRINTLNQRLDELRLNYKETYPDIIQLKWQVESLQNEQFDGINQREAAIKDGIYKAPRGAVAQELKRIISMSQAKILSLKGKSKQLQILIERERGALASISAVEAEVAELNRDYNVNQSMYQDLLEQRERARVSMNMDIKNQGLTMKIQEEAVLQVIPKGLRFLHLILAGLVISIVVPIALIYAITLFDQKVRNEPYLREGLRLPILAAVYNTKNATDSHYNAMKFGVIGITLLTIWSVYGYVIMSRIQG